MLNQGLKISRGGHIWGGAQSEFSPSVSPVLKQAQAQAVCVRVSVCVWEGVAGCLRWMYEGGARFPMTASCPRPERIPLQSSLSSQSDSRLGSPHPRPLPIHLAFSSFWRKLQGRRVLVSGCWGAPRPKAAGSKTHLRGLGKAGRRCRS